MPHNKLNKGGENYQKCLILFEIKEFCSLNNLNPIFSQTNLLRGLVDFKTLNSLIDFGNHGVVIDNKRLLVIGDFQQRRCLRIKIKVHKSLSLISKEVKEKIR